MKGLVLRGSRSWQIISHAHFPKISSYRSRETFTFRHTKLPDPDDRTTPAWSGPKYAWYDEFVESLEHYGPGGYHPVHLGDRFSTGRYEVIHKLGHGGYSLVWLCKDLQEHKYVSLKVAKSDLPGAEQQRDCELDVHYALRNGSEGHPGKRFVIKLLDDFILNGPNGSHQCFVFPFAFNNVAIAKEASKDDSCMFPTQIARSIATQSLLGLSYVHACGIVHAGTICWILGHIQWLADLDLQTSIPKISSSRRPRPDHGHLRSPTSVLENCQ